MCCSPNCTIICNISQLVLQECGAEQFFDVGKNVVLSGEVGIQTCLNEFMLDRLWEA